MFNLQVWKVLELIWYWISVIKVGDLEAAEEFWPISTRYCVEFYA